MSDEVKRRRRRGYTRVSPKHQITIPAEALREGGVRVGDQLKVDVRGRSIVLTPVTDPLEEFAGSLSYPAGYLEELRREWE
jgi:bifunctional DNA-binding transcriptional regulator/antitoxin component of YhaV-PrlF toxin-antitoxin module